MAFLTRNWLVRDRVFKRPTDFHSRDGFYVDSPDRTRVVCSRLTTARRHARQQASTIPGLTTISLRGLVIDTYCIQKELK